MQITPKAARINAGLTQEFAAESLGISRTTIQNYENYKTNPDVEMAKRMAALYGMDLNDIKFCK